MKYDTIIIGAGLSGLAAGIRLAYFDKRVCILERHYTIGGLNSFYRLRRRDYDVGLHAVTNYARPGTKTGPLSKLLRQLRLSWEDFSLRPQLGSRVVFPGYELEFTNEFDVLRASIARTFPAQAAGFESLLAQIDAHDPLRLDRHYVSAREVLGSHLSDPVLIDMLFCPVMFYGSATARDMDFNQFVIMFRSLFQEGFGRPYEGVRLMLKKVVKQFRGQGGELRLRAGVSQIKQHQGRAVGVVLEDGSELEADNVLSSAGSVETLRLCQLADPPRWEPGEISFVESISFLDRSPAELDHHDTIVFYNNTERFRYDCPDEPVDLQSGIICSPNNFEYDEPLPFNKIRMTALANPAYWLNPDLADYEAQKSAWQQRMLADAVRIMPDFRPHIIDSDMFTPRTIKKFTGHINGCVYGAPTKLVDGRTPLDNLYLCGTDQGFLGIIGSMLSGISIANKYLLS